MMKIKFFFKEVTKKYNLLILFLLLLFFIFRVIYVLFFGGFDKSEFMDASGYNIYAKEILNGINWLSNTDFIASFREPVYPLFVAILYFIFGIENFFIVYLTQTIIGTISIFLIYRISIEVINDRKSAILSLVWGGFYIFYLRFTGELLRETLIVFLVLLLFYRFVKMVKSGSFSVTELFFAALIYVLLIHTDGRYLFYAPFFFIFFIKYQEKTMEAFKKFILFGIFVIFFTIPWTIRNYIAYDELIIVSKYTLNLSGKSITERGDLFNTSLIDSAYTTIHYAHNKNYPSKEERSLIKSGLNPNNRCASEVDLIKRDICPAKTFLGRKWYYVKSMWKPCDFTYSYAPFPQAYFMKPWSLKHNILSIVCYGTLLPFFFIGLYTLIKQKNQYLLLIILPVLIHLLLHFLTFGMDRYRHPIDAFIIILGCYGIIAVYGLIKSRGIPNNS